MNNKKPSSSGLLIAMEFYYSKALNFTIDFPDDWTAEENGNILSVHDPVNGYGALQFSSYEVDNPESINLKEELDNYLSDRHKYFEVQDFSRYAFCKCDDEKGSQWQYWIFIKGNILLFASYNSLKEDAGKEDSLIKAVIDSAIKNAQMNPA